MANDKRFIPIEGKESFKEQVSIGEFNEKVCLNMFLFHPQTFEMSVGRYIENNEVIKQVDSREAQNSVININDALMKHINSEVDAILKPTRDILIEMFKKKHPFLKRET